MARGDLNVRVAVVGDGRSAQKMFADLGRAARESSRQLSQAGSQARTAGGHFTRFGDVFKGVLAANVVTAGFRAVTGGMADTVRAASDLNETINKTEVVFGRSAAGIDQWATTAASRMGISRQEAEETAATFGNFFGALGIGQGRAAEMSTRMVQLASDMASFNNAAPVEVLQDLRSGLAGQIEPLRKYGVDLSEVTLKAEAMRLGLVKTATGTLPASTKAQAAYSLILKQTTTAQGDFARTSDGLANQQRILAARVQDLKANLGTALLPAINDLIPAIQGVAGWLGKHLPDAISTARREWGILAGAFEGDAAPKGRLSGVERMLRNIGLAAGDAFRGAKRAWQDFITGIGGGPKPPPAPPAGFHQGKGAQIEPGAPETSGWEQWGERVRAAIGKVGGAWHDLVVGVTGGSGEMNRSLDTNRSAWEKFGGGIRAAGGWIGQAFSNVAGALRGVFSNPAVQAGMRFLGSQFRALANDVTTKLLPALKEFWQQAGPILTPILKLLAIIVGVVLFGAILAIVEAFRFVIAVVTNVIKWFGSLFGAIKTLLTVFLEVVGGIIHGAAIAFGWIPGLGPKLKGADAAFRDFKDNVNAHLNNIHDKKVNVTAVAGIDTTHEFNSALQAIKSGHPMGGMAAGGLVIGPGGPTSDRIPAMLSAGEAVIPARLVPAVAPFLAANRVPGFAAGGLVGDAGDQRGVTVTGSGSVGPLERGLVVLGGQINRLADALRGLVQPVVNNAAAKWSSMVGTAAGGITGLGPFPGKVGDVIAYGLKFLGIPYQWGGTGPRYDCSGLMQAIFAHFGIGLPRIAADQARMGMPGTGAAGDLVYFGSPAHHIGLSVGGGRFLEAPHTGDVVKIAPWGSPTGFRRVLSYDQGGWLPSGFSLAYNGTGRPERVVPPGGRGPAQITVNVATMPGGEAEAGRRVVEAIRQYERRAGAGWRN